MTAPLAGVRVPDLLVDLKSEQGRKVLLRLADTADAVVESFRRAGT
jgi:crotonobetainyl-CoA:carnitine CoA-transferase CaiB-like acyl-CoA transferase